MARTWTFGKKISAGFAAAVTITVVMGVVAVGALRSVVASKDRVITVNAQLLLDAQVLNTDATAKAAGIRGYMLIPENQFKDDWKAARAEFDETLRRLKNRATTEEGQRQLDLIAGINAEFDQAAERVFTFRLTNPTMEAAARFLAENPLPKRLLLQRHIKEFQDREAGLLEAVRQESSRTARSAMTGVAMMMLGCGAVAAVLAIWLTRTLKNQIGSAVGQVQNSSAELQATASQQATGAKEQATAMNEITTTISELLATSRQIAESAQRVAKIAEQTAQSARSGDGTVAKAKESMGSIRAQVDLLVSHMTELGKKSQQIGAVLDIVSELAEQTNILAINATIEAVGAGESGKRFAVVADEIRKLADRVALSTKEIRGLIEDVRGAVNTTIMTTESGSKAVEAGTRQFAEVASTFNQISGLATTTMEAAREIELSTKQQTSGVEQVNSAIIDVLQATRETEANTGQTLQTVSALAGLSTDLSRLIQPQA